MASCRTEIEGLEEHIVNHEGDIEPTIFVLNGLVAMTRYCRFLLFGFVEDELGFESGSQKKPKTHDSLYLYFFQNKPNLSIFYVHE